MTTTHNCAWRSVHEQIGRAFPVVFSIVTRHIPNPGQERYWDIHFDQRARDTVWATYLILRCRTTATRSDDTLFSGDLLLQDQASVTGLPVVERFFIPLVVMALAPETSALDTGWRRDQVLVMALILCGTFCAVIVVAAAVVVAYVNQATKSTQPERERSCGGMLKQSSIRRSVMDLVEEVDWEQGAEGGRGEDESEQAGPAGDSSDAAGASAERPQGEGGGHAQQVAVSAGGGRALSSPDHDGLADGAS